MKGTERNGVLQVICPNCEHDIKLESGVIAMHAAASGELCGLSGSAASIPQRTLKADYDCGSCGQTTKSNLLTGVVFSHNLPGSRDVCETSGRFIGPVGATVSAVLLPEPKMKASKRSFSRSRSSYPEESGNSVRTVSGGLPGSNRRS